MQCVTTFFGLRILPKNLTHTRYWDTNNLKFKKQSYSTFALTGNFACVVMEVLASQGIEFTTRLGGNWMRCQFTHILVYR